MSARRSVVVDYDAVTVVAMLAALHTCPSDLRLDSLAVVVKLFAENHPFVTSQPVHEEKLDPQYGQRGPE